MSFHVISVAFALLHMTYYTTVKVPNMRYILLSTLLMWSLYAEAQPEQWITYKDAVSEEFSVEVPISMEVKTKEMETSLGKLKSVAYTVEGTEDDANMLYLITKVAYPAGTFPADSIELAEEYLTEAVTTTAESVGGEVVYVSRSDRSGPITYLFRLKYSGGQAVIKGKAIISGDSFYLLQVYCHTNDSLNSEMDDFLNSFTLH